MISLELRSLTTMISIDIVYDVAVTVFIEALEPFKSAS